MNNQYESSNINLFVEVKTIEYICDMMKEIFILENKQNECALLYLG